MYTLRDLLDDLKDFDLDAEIRPKEADDEADDLFEIINPTRIHGYKSWLITTDRTNTDWEDNYDEDCDWDLEMGFNPYSGCYDYDC